MGFLSLICYLLEGGDHTCKRITPSSVASTVYGGREQPPGRDWNLWKMMLSFPWHHPVSRWTVGVDGGPLLLPSTCLPTLLHSGMSSFRRERGDIIHTCMALPFNSSQMHKEAFMSSAFVPGVLICVSEWINDVKDPNTEKTHQSCKWH